LPSELNATENEIKKKLSGSNLKEGWAMVGRSLLKFAVVGAMAAMLTVGVSSTAFAQGAATPHKKKPVMHTYVIERTIPGAGSFSKEKLHDISQKSNGILKDMGPNIQWVQSYVTGDKIYCIYKAENADLIREHAKRGGFPADSVNEVDTMISPATGK
jgi:hypothetical protein